MPDQGGILQKSIEDFFGVMGLPPVGAMAFDVRPCFVWRANGERIAWSNSAGIRFFGEKSLNALLAREFQESNPLRLHIARLIRSARGDAPVLERIRFYTGFKSVSTTCLAKRVSGTDGEPLLIMVVTQSFSLNARTSARDMFLKDMADRDGFAAVFSASGDVEAATARARDFRPDAGWYGFLEDLATDYRPKPVELAFGNSSWSGVIVPIGDEIKTEFIFCADREVVAFGRPDAAREDDRTGQPLDLAPLGTPPAVERIYIEDIADGLLPGLIPGVTAPADGSDDGGLDTEPDETDGEEREDPTFAELEARLRELTARPEPEGGSPSTDGPDDPLSSEPQEPETDEQPEEKQPDDLPRLLSNVTWLKPGARENDRPSQQADREPSARVIDAFSGRVEDKAAGAGDPPPVIEDVPFVPPAGKPIRFTWQTDANGIITHVSIGLSEAVGPHASDIIGSTWENLRGALKLDLSGEVLNALGSGDTWTGLRVFWPVEGHAKVVPVDLSALPVKTADETFEGYRGFGICHMDRLEDDPTERGVGLAPRPVDGSPLPAPTAAPALRAVKPDDNEPEEASPAPNLVDDSAESAPEAPADTVTSAEESNSGDADAPEEAEDDALSAFDSKPAKDRPLNSRDELNRHEEEAFRKIGDLLSPRLLNDTVPGGDSTPEAEEAEAEEPEVTAPVAEEQAAGAAAPDKEVETETATAVPGAINDEPPAEAAGNEALLDSVPSALLVTRDQDILFANSSALELLRYRSRDELNSGPEFRAVFPGSPHDEQDAATFPVLAADGDWLDLHVIARPLTWDGGEATLLELSEPAPAAEPAETGAVPTRELEAILDTATDGILVLDREGLIQRMNSGAEALFNIERQDAVGHPLTGFLAEESRGGALDYLDGLLHNGVASVLNDGREVTGMARGGGAVPLFMTMGRIDDGDDGRFCAVLRDISQWKDAQRDLVAARKRAETENSQKSDFVAKISHEIRTPLNAIIGFSEVMMEERFGPVDNRRYRDYLRDIHVSGSHIMALINDLLDLAKIEAGKMDLDFGSVSIERTIEKCMSLLQPQANKDRVIIRSGIAEGIPPVVADERSLNQIMLNLLSNAVKFTPSGGQVIISSSYDDTGEVSIRVRDTGKGMTEEEIKAALEPFRQVRSSDAARVAGTGLGLPLTKALVEANRARFSIASEPGRGTLIKITFPNSRVLAS